jgi:type-F conjugative transfer system pilin assembly protein TrbC
MPKSTFFRPLSILIFILLPAVSAPDVVTAASQGSRQNDKKESGSYRRGRTKPKPDVVVPKIEILNELELPENFSNPEGLQQYMEEIQAQNLLPTNQESPLAAKHLLPVVNPDNPVPGLNQWTNDVADMLLERGGITGEARKRVLDYIDMNRPKSPYEDLRLIVFVSSSVPDATIRHLVDRLGDSPNVVFALRGFVDNDPQKAMPTMNWLKAHRCRSAGSDTVCAAAPMDINPVLFTRMKIERVPAIAYIPEPKALANCSDDEPLDEEDYLIFYGDVSPEYILERFQQARPEDVALRDIVAQVKPVIWENAGPSGVPADVPPVEKAQRAVATKEVEDTSFGIEQPAKAD